MTPDVDRIAELEREIAEQEDLAARCLTEHKYIFYGRAQFLRAELSRLHNEQPRDKTDAWDREHAKSRVIIQDENGRFEAIDKRAPPGLDGREVIIAAIKTHVLCDYHAGIRDAEAAADEILAALAQSDAQPVGWRYAYRSYPDQWHLTTLRHIYVIARDKGCIIEPLYASGLMEAARQSAFEEAAKIAGEQPKGGDAALIPNSIDPTKTAGPGDSAESPGPQDVREALEEAAKAAAYLIDRLQACLAGKPVRDLDEALEAYANRTNEAALAQSDAEPVTTPGTTPDLDELTMLTQEFKGYSLLALMQEAHRLRQAQSDARPVGWQLVPKEPTAEMLKNVTANEDEDDALYIWHGMLAAAPPRPDASDASGLVDAAELAEEHANKHCYDSQAEQRLLHNFAKILRARAADRSGK